MCPKKVNREKKKSLKQKNKSPDFIIDSQFVRRKLLAWYRVHGRDFPWRQTNNSFHLLIAEMMLRRTKADQVVRVYQTFTHLFQSPEEAAQLSLKEIEKLCRPLGLHYRGSEIYRAIHHLNLHKDAIPDSLEEIPGIGPYSAAMIRSKLFYGREAAIDSNVVRIIARLSGIPFYHELRRNKNLIAAANHLHQTKHASSVNLALIDLAALICKPAPSCSQCPLQTVCKFDLQKQNYFIS